MTTTPGTGTAPAATADVLVVGAGPAGLATAIAAVRNGARVLVVERHAGTSVFPRASGTHLRTMEIFRSWGLHRRIQEQDLRIRPLRSVSRTLADATPSAAIGYPTDPREILAASPVLPACCPQDRLEPILLEHLRALGGEVRFGIALADLTDDGAGVTATLRERTSDATTTVRARFVVGADGTRSHVREVLGVPMRRLGELGEYVNILFTARLDDLLGDRRFGLYVVEHPDAEGIVIRLGDDRWGLTRQWYPERGESPADFTPGRCLDLVRTAIGDPRVDVQLSARLPFAMIAEIAGTFRVGNGFLVGDAAHRLTPVGALGMNTAIQSAHNLGWKLAWVARGRAGHALLDSYEAERRPVAESNARRSLQMGLTMPGDSWRAVLDRPYSSPVIAPGPSGGRRAPHAWVTVDGRRRSTLDLFDGRFTLLVGRAATGWRTAAAGCDLSLQVLSDDPLTGRLGIGDDGAALVRPDGHIAWSSPCAPHTDGALAAALGMAIGANSRADRPGAQAA